VWQSKNTGTKDEEHAKVICESAKETEHEAKSGKLSQERVSEILVDTLLKTGVKYDPVVPVQTILAEACALPESGFFVYLIQSGTLLKVGKTLCSFGRACRATVLTIRHTNCWPLVASRTLNKCRLLRCACIRPSSHLEKRMKGNGSKITAQLRERSQNRVPEDHHDGSRPIGNICTARSPIHPITRILAKLVADESSFFRNRAFIFRPLCFSRILYAGPWN
jgi:hypothetical protein